MRYALTAPLVLSLAACTSVPETPMKTVENVDLQRFMGDWYVIANIPTFLERGAHNAVESYELLPDRKVATRFRFRDGAFDGPIKVYNPTGFIRDESNAVWGMQFIWPIKADYRIAHLDDEYTETIIARNQRDYVWIMARTPAISDEAYARMVELIDDIGYDVTRLRKVPQSWQEG